MKKDIFIGVDGGATKCKVRIEDAEGNLIGEARGGPTTIRYSTERAWLVILTTITEALKPHKIDLEDKDYNFHIGCGLTGFELPDASERFLKQTPEYFSSIVLNADSYTACLGAHEGNDGAIIIIGTGVVARQIQHGNTIQIGGWGFPHGDEGGGAWLGMEAVRLTLQWIDGRFESDDTDLLKAIFNKFDNDATKFVVWSVAANSTRFAEIAPLIMAKLEKKDPLAIMFVKRAAAEIDKIGVALKKRTEGDIALPCCLFGGLAPFIQPYLSEELKSRIVPRKHDATYGAILLIKKKLQLI